MANKLIRTGYTQIIPANPGRPPTPARTVSYTVTITSAIPGGAGGSGGSWVYLPPDSGSGDLSYSGGRYVWAPGGGGTAGGTSMAALPTSPKTVTYTYTIPADPGEPATPEQRIFYPPLGWTSSAESIATISAGYGQFSIEAGVHGVAIGLVPASVPTPEGGYGHIARGLLFTGGRIKRIPEGYDYGSYSRGDVFRITLQPSLGAEGVDLPPPHGNPGATPVHVASVPGNTGWVTVGNADANLFSYPTQYTPGERMRLAAVMYGPQDAVFDPSMVQASNSGWSEAVLGRMEVSSGDYETASSFARLGGLEVSSGAFNRSEARLGGLSVFSSDRPLAQSFAVMPALSASSYDSPEIVQTNESFAILTGVSVSSSGLSGGTGSGVAELDGLMVLSSDRPYAASVATFGGMEASSYDYPSGMVAIVPEFGLFDGIQSQAIYKASIPLGFGLGTTMGASIAANERIDFGFVLDIPLETSTIETADISPVFWFDAPLECPGAFMDAWAVNLDNGASTEYRSYPFETVANIGGRYFGAAFEGLYELSGDTDAGAPIEAKFDIGRKDFGNNQLKRVDQIYLGITSKGQMFVKVSAEGASYTYPMREFGEHIQTQRVTVGKGMRANYFGFEIGNTAGCDFEITSLNMMVAESARRI